MWKRIGGLAVCGLLLAAAGARGEAESQAQIIEQILELQRRIEELLAKLPPEVRQALRARLAEPDAVEPAAVSGEPAPAAVEEAPPVASAAPQPAAAPAAGAEAEPVPTGTPAIEPRRRRAAREKCNTLLPLDESGDGRISSADRYWRYFYVWLDGNSDGQMQEREIESAYDQKIREIDVSLETFLRAKGGLGEIRVGDRVVLDLRGDGFSERSRRDDGVLLLDAEALRRGDGPELLGPGGETLDGFQPFRAGLEIREASGRLVALNCPGGRTAGD